MINSPFFEIENNDQIMEYKTSDGVSMWLFMRHEFFERMSTFLFQDYYVSQDRDNNASALIYIVKASIYNAMRYLKSDHHTRVGFYTISREVVRDGRYLNQYTDAYAELLGNNCISIQHPPLDWEWKFPRENNNIILSAPALAASSVIGKVMKSVDYIEAERLFDYANGRLLESEGFSMPLHEKNRIVKACIYEIERSKHYANWMHKICKKFNVKCMIMLGGSYSWYYYLNKKLKDNGIKTADLQHGWISKTNNVYNYSETIVNHKDIMEGSPNFFLTYGSFWSDQSNIPYNAIIPIGNPFRDEETKKLVKKFDKRISLIGCSRNTKGYLELAKRLADEYPDYEIVFRPHPTERLEVSKINENNDKVVIDTQGDLYELLSSTEIVIAEMSTVLFEAVGVVPKIVVWRTKYSKYVFPDCPFSFFETEQQLNELIKNNNFIIPETKAYWDPNWITNFTSFIEQFYLGRNE